MIRGDAILHYCDMVSLIAVNQDHWLGGNTAVVALSSRDWLGLPSDPMRAAQAASLVAVSRSLALCHASLGLTVNVRCILANPMESIGSGPRPLLPGGVGAKRVLNAIEFFLDSRSYYITGQALHVCGGASLLSSLSV